jgi:hypothetical protein
VEGYPDVCGVICRYYTSGPGLDGKLFASEVKGQIMLQGAAVDIYKDTRFNIRQADEKRVMYLKADSADEVKNFSRRRRRC